MNDMTDTSLVNPISLEIFRGTLTAIAEEMGVVLTRSSYSPNIKERRDFSCALFDVQGRLIAQAAHIPVHLGAMPDSVAAALAAFDHFAPGDIIALNDPFLGGSHLPDITLIAPMFAAIEGQQRLIGFAANRAHHSDVGGMSAGSMPLATEIYQEGIIIPPTKLWEAGQPNAPLLALILRNVRTPHERRGDLAAQVAANRTAVRRMQELVSRWGLLALEAHIDALIAYAQRITEATIEAIPDGSYSFTDYLDDDGIGTTPVQITATVTVHGNALTGGLYRQFSTGAGQCEHGGVGCEIGIVLRCALLNAGGRAHEFWHVCPCDGHCAGGNGGECTSSGSGGAREC